jgi:hypothetical protein
MVPVHIDKQCCGCRSGIRCFFEPWEKIRIRDGKNPDPESGYGMNNPDHFSESLENNFLDQKYLNSLMRIRDIFDPESEMEKFGSGILHKHYG